MEYNIELYDNHDHLSIGEHEEHMNGSSDLQARIEKEIERIKEQPKKGLISPFKRPTIVKEKIEPTRDYLSDIEQKRRNRTIANERLGRTTFCLRETLHDDCHEKRRQAIERMKLLDEEDIADSIEQTVVMAKKTISTPKKYGEERYDPLKATVAPRYLQSPPPKQSPQQEHTPEYKSKSRLENVKSRYLNLSSSIDKSPRQILEEKKEQERKKTMSERPFRPSSYNARKDPIIEVTPVKTPRPASHRTTPSSRPTSRSPKNRVPSPHTPTSQQTPQLTSPTSTPVKPSSQTKKTPKTTPRLIEFKEEEEKSTVQEEAEFVVESGEQEHDEEEPSSPVLVLSTEPLLSDSVIEEEGDRRLALETDGALEEAETSPVMHLSEDLPNMDLVPEDQNDLLTTEFSAEETQLLSKLELEAEE